MFQDKNFNMIKNTVYTKEANTLEELKDKIEHTINAIPSAVIQMVFCSV